MSILHVEPHPTRMHLDRLATAGSIRHRVPSALDVPKPDRFLSALLGTALLVAVALGIVAMAYGAFGA